MFLTRTGACEKQDLFGNNFLLDTISVWRNRLLGTKMPFDIFLGILGIFTHALGGMGGSALIRKPCQLKVPECQVYQCPPY